VFFRDPETRYPQRNNKETGRANRSDKRLFGKSDQSRISMPQAIGRRLESQYCATKNGRSVTDAPVQTFESLPC
jgi:hypothetical protein